MDIYISEMYFYNTCMSGKDLKAHHYIMMEANPTYIGFLLFTKFWSNFFVMKNILSAVCGSLASHDYCCPSSLHDALLATHFLMMQISAPLSMFLTQSRMKTLL